MGIPTPTLQAKSGRWPAYVALGAFRAQEIGFVGTPWCVIQTLG